jgi:hypothetical protein
MEHGLCRLFDVCPMSPYIASGTKDLFAFSRPVPMRLWVTTACKEVPCRMLVSNPADPILRVKAGAGSKIWQIWRAPSKVSIVLQ